MSNPRLRLWFAGGLGFMALIAVVLSLAAIFGTFTNTKDSQETTNDIRETQLEGTPFGKSLQKGVDDIAATLAILKDCLDPNGVCGKETAAKQAQIARRLHRDTIAIVVCADQPGEQTRAEIESCAKKVPSGG